jgi:hypothetical protein
MQLRFAVPVALIAILGVRVAATAADKAGVDGALPCPIVWVNSVQEAAPPNPHGEVSLPS